MARHVLWLAVMATKTDRLTLGPTCTNPSTRNPFVTAQAIATIDELSGNRACIGIGTGQSAIKMCASSTADVGPSPSGARRHRFSPTPRPEYEPWPSGIEIDERVVELAWVTHRTPILVIGGGPKGGRCAAEMGDGIMFRAGDVAWSEFPARMEQLRAWRAEGPRAADPFEVQMTLPSYLAASDDELARGRMLLGPVVAAMAHASMREEWLPEELVEPWRIFAKDYDYSHHVSTANRHNMNVMERLGLAEFLFERYSFTGTLDQMVDRLFELQAMGITAVNVGFGHSVDKVEADEQFERAIEIRNRYLTRLGPDAVAEGPLAAGASVPTATG